MYRFLIRIVLFLALPYRSIEQTKKPSDRDDAEGATSHFLLTHVILSAFLVGIHLSVTFPALFTA